MRGTGFLQAFRCLPTRITPACAGNSLLPWMCQEPDKDHPRVCGEQTSGRITFASWCGSPPRVRGTELNLYEHYGLIRITPACAGNRACMLHPAAGYKDHPRVCGEQNIIKANYPKNTGSPPRVRGTVFPSFAKTLCHRITPACAGNRLKKARHFYILFCQIKRIHLV